MSNPVAKAPLIEHALPFGTSSPTGVALSPDLTFEEALLLQYQFAFCDYDINYACEYLAILPYSAIYQVKELAWVGVREFGTTENFGTRYRRITVAWARSNTAPPGDPSNATSGTYYHDYPLTPGGDTFSGDFDSLVDDATDEAFASGTGTSYDYTLDEFTATVTLSVSWTYAEFVDAFRALDWTTTANASPYYGPTLEVDVSPTEIEMPMYGRRWVATYAPESSLEFTELAAERKLKYDDDSIVTVDSLETGSPDNGYITGVWPESRFDSPVAALTTGAEDRIIDIHVIEAATGYDVAKNYTGTVARPATAVAAKNYLLAPSGFSLNVPGLLGFPTLECVLQAQSISPVGGTDSYVLPSHNAIVQACFGRLVMDAGFFTTGNAYPVVGSLTCSWPGYTGTIDTRCFPYDGHGFWPVGTPPTSGVTADITLSAPWLDPGAANFLMGTY